MSIFDLFVVIVKFIFLSVFNHVWEITFLVIYKATDKLDSDLINTQVLLQVNTVKESLSLYRAFWFI